VRELAFDDLVLCAGTVSASGLKERVQAAAAAGYTGISVFADDYDRARADGLSDADLRALLDDHGLGIAEIDPLMNWVPTADLSTGANEQGRGFFAHGEEKFFAIADAIGGRAINAVLVSDTEIPHEQIVECFAGLCDRAKAHDLLVALEFLPWTQIRSVREAMRVVRDAGRANGGLMLDSWHHFRGGVGIDEIPAERVFGIQLNDAPATPMADLIEETTRHRLLPGEGAFDLRGLLSHLKVGGCSAPVGVEIFSDALQGQPVADVAKRTADATRAVLP